MAKSWDFEPEFNPELISRPSDLVNRFGFSFAYNGCNASSLCNHTVLFDWVISQLVLSDLGILVTAGVHFDMSGKILYPGGDSVWAGQSVLVSGDTRDKDRLLVTMPACVLMGGLVRCLIGPYHSRACSCREFVPEFVPGLSAGSYARPSGGSGFVLRFCVACIVCSNCPICGDSFRTVSHRIACISVKSCW